MTVGQLIDKLKEYPQDMPIAVVGDIHYDNKDDPEQIEIRQRTWVDGNYPYDSPDFDYIDLE